MKPREVLHQIRLIISAGETNSGEFNGDTEYAIAEIRKALAAPKGESEGETPEQAFKRGFNTGFIERGFPEYKDYKGLEVPADGSIRARLEEAKMWRTYTEGTDEPYWCAERIASLEAALADATKDVSK